MTFDGIRTTRPLSRSGARSLAAGLGWFSLGLGLAQLLKPRSFTRRLGMRGGEALVQGFGAREVATGVGILAARDPAPWLWGRVGGDALDLATLASLHRNNARRDTVGLALLAVAGIAVLDIVAAQSLSAEPPGRGRARGEEKRRMIAAYRGRSGLPRPVAAMRGAARDFKIPDDFRAPEAMRPWTA